MSSFCDKHCFKSIAKESTCFKNPRNPLFMYSLLTNFIFEIGASEFQQIIITELKFFQDELFTSH